MAWISSRVRLMKSCRDSQCLLYHTLDTISLRFALLSIVSRVFMCKCYQSSSVMGLHIPVNRFESISESPLGS